MDTAPTYRIHAIWAGIFFIIATAFLFVGESFYKPGLTDPDVLTAAADASNDIAFGILIEFACVLAIPLIAIALYPVLRNVSAALAVGYVAFRLFEASIFFQMEIDRLLVLAISREYAASPTQNTDQIDLLIHTMMGGEAWSGTTGPLYNLVFVTGMLMLNWMLWKSVLVPRWISGWGMLSGGVLGGLAIVVLFTEVTDAVAIALIAPLAVQEMVLALWFIFKGFDQTALAKLTPPVTVGEAAPRSTTSATVLDPGELSRAGARATETLDQRT